MRRRTRDFGHLKLIFAFLFISVFIPNVLNAINSNAAGALGSFEAGETGIKLCAQIDAGPEDSLRFLVTNNQGFSSDIIVAKDTCKKIKTEAATYTIKQYLSQEYTLDSVSGGTVSADNTPFVATAAGRYSIIYSNEYTAKGYLHSFGYTATKQIATAVDVHFDANGGTGTMNTQRFGINSSQTLTANAFTRTDYAFVGWNTASDGSGTSYTDEQSVAFATGGEVTLYAQWEYASRVATDIIAHQANDLGDYTIDFTRGAAISNVITTANGNGVNKYIENNTDIYYYRGQIYNNNVIWANKCWKIVRTTATGGTKMIYNGLPTDVIVDGNTVKQCNATGMDSQIAVNIDGNDVKTFAFNNGDTSPADVGYMYGVRIEESKIQHESTVFTFSNNVSRNGNTYTLDTATGQSISGTWEDERLNAATRYHYFCTDGATTCDNTKIGYITSFIAQWGRIYYLKIDGYDNIEDLKSAMFANTTDSNAKAMIETWFEQQNLDGHIDNTRNYEDDLEDAVFCNDRSYYSGSLKGKDSDATSSNNMQYSYHNAYMRNAIKNEENNYSPSLDCPVTDDAFTKDIANGNGKLKHKVGLITADELTIAGNYWRNGNLQFDVYLYSGAMQHTASPLGHGGNGSPHIFNFYANQNNNLMTSTTAGLRPMVSLKASTEFASGTGLSTDPYIVE